MATWEDWETLKIQFPAMLTWGQAQFPGEPVMINMAP
jgi:hypothetical protein